jgi:hypothetical protein
MWPSPAGRGSGWRWIGALVLLVSALAAGASPAAAGRSAACGRAGYSYAGFASAERAHGVRAGLTALTEPSVANGHVAAWVGVGGAGEGPGGTDAWLQVGVSAVAGVDDSALYYEVVRPGRAPRYTFLGDVRADETHDVAVLEVAGRPGTWRVWVDGEARTAAIELPGSSGRWRPIATAETWDGGRRVCNRFDFSFARVQVAGRPGGSWRPFVGGQRFQDPGYRVVTRSASSFRATAAA